MPSIIKLINRVFSHDAIKSLNQKAARFSPYQVKKILRSKYITSFFFKDRIRSCLLKHFTRKIKITVNRRFDVSNIILKIEVVYANVKVVKRELKILNI